MTEETLEFPAPEAEEAPKKKRTKKASAATNTPGHWMIECGATNKGPKRGNAPRASFPNWRHSCAAALHGWDQHEHDAQAPIQLTKADYEAALEAAGSNPLKPHPGALSPYCKHTFGD